MVPAACALAYYLATGKQQQQGRLTHAAYTLLKKSEAASPR